MKPKIIIHKYGTEAEHIYSVGAGYQSYYTWSKNFQPHIDGSVRRDTRGKKDSQVRYNITSQERIGKGVTQYMNAEPGCGLYIGNRR